MSIIHPARRFDYATLLDMLHHARSQCNVNMVQQPETGLALWCYTKKAVYERAWHDPAVVLARGLILDIPGRKVVATPFPKFFNIGEWNEPFPNRPFEAFEKLDGSLIIIFHHRGKWRAATKGSLTSPQAGWAQRWLNTHPRVTNTLMPGTTYLAEAIYPENRIVIQYTPEKTGLQLLGGYAEDGKELSYTHLFQMAQITEFGIAKRVPFSSVSDLITAQKKLPATEEGWVIRFDNGHRLKVKGDEYCRIHRFISRCTPLAVWEWMAEGKPTEDFRKELPEEFWQDFDTIVALLNQKLTNIIVRVGAVVREWQNLSDKEVGLQINELPDDVRSFVFPMRKHGDLLANSKTCAALYRKIRPTHNVLEGYKPSTSINRVLAEAA